MLHVRQILTWNKFFWQASGNMEFGTVFDASNSFNVFIGSPSEFPMLKLRSPRIDRFLVNDNLSWLQKLQQKANFS